MRTALIASALLLTAAGVVAYRQRQEAASENDQGEAEEITDYFTDAAQEAAQVIDGFTGGTMKLSAMAQVRESDVADRNVQAFLRVIRRGEGTSDEAGYRRIFGGTMFNSFAQHPNIKITKSGYTSTAAGAFQFLKSTWDETARLMGLIDFSPASQERGAVGRIAARGALEDVKAGRFESAIRKCAKEWASLPFSPYGQPTISLSTAAQVYASAGGVVTA